MKRELWKHFDFWLFGGVVVLCIFGIVMIRSAIAGNADLATSVDRQAIWVGIGIVVILILTLVDYHYWASLSRPMYIFTFLLLVFTYVTATAHLGAARWLEAGTIFIQPAELAKIVIILVLADYFAKNKDQPHDLRWVFRSLLLTGGTVIWIYLQPNLSNTIVILVIWFALLWLSGLPVRYLIIFIGLAILIAVFTFPLLQGYQQERVFGFVFQDQSATYGDRYNVDQALISIGSGGLFGQGYGHGTQVQLRFLKVRHTDFIFSAMASEFGFIGTILIIALLVFVIFRCFRAASLASDAYGAYIAFGFGFLLFFQTAVNIGVNLSVIPVTGLTLPFISYGGSSLLTLTIGIGLIESVIVRHKSLEF
jgi:rod shape determining protein RodA